MPRRPITNPLEYLQMVRRRWVWLLAPWLLISTATVLISRRMPKLYQSDALIQVEPQKVPADFVKPTVSSNVALRLQSIQEDILSRTDLSQIITKYGLYRNQKLTADQQVTKMLGNIAVSPIVLDPDHPNAEVTAFRISFADANPELAQQVTRDLSSQFITKNLDLRAQQSQGTEAFIDGRLQQAQQALQVLQDQLRAVKKQYMGSLPEQESANLQVMNQLNSSLQANSDALARAQQERTYLLSLGEAVSQLSPVQQAQANGPSPTELKLQQAQTTLATMEKLYTPAYPDVVRQKAEVQALQAQVDAAKPAPAKPATATATATGKNPPAGKAPAANPEESALAALLPQQRGQIALLDKEIQRYTSDGKAIEVKIGALQAHIERLPEVEQKLANITNETNVAKATYNSLLEKKSAASTAAAMEQQAEGQEFRIVDPANLPLVPTSPNLPRIYAMGIVGGLLLGCALAFLAEMRDPVLRGELDLAFYTQAPLLAVLPLLAPAAATPLSLPAAGPATN